MCAAASAVIERKPLEVDSNRLNEFMGKALTDIAAAFSVPLMIIGEKLGLYKAMAGAGPLTSAQLATKTNTHERYVREWLLNQAAGGYVTYDPQTQAFTLPNEHALALADPDSTVYLHGAYEIIQSAFRDFARIQNDFKNAGGPPKGVGWGEHDACCFVGTERFFRPGYNGNLITSWIPALDGVKAKLERGAKVGDLGCGHGASTIIMAKAFPKSQFIGIDFHGPSIERARKAAADAGCSSNITFQQARSTDFAGRDFDFICCFDCLHDMGDPVGCAKHVRQALKPDGIWMVVEPFANDNLEDNLNPVGRCFSAASALICVPASLSENGPALGAQAGEKRLREVIADKGGFTRFRRATQTPFNLILEARP